MPKVITSQELENFIRTGASTHIEPYRPASKSAPSLETAPSVPVADAKAAPKTAAVTSVDPAVANLAEDLHIAESFAKQESTRARLAEERAAELEREKAAQKTPAQPPKPADDPTAPKIAQFTDSNGTVDWDRYTTEKSEYAARMAVQNEKNRAAQQERDAAFKTRLDDAKTRYPDFLEVLEKADVMIQDDVLAYISASEAGADITYHLAKHEDEAERIRKLNPRQALAEIGKLEEKAPWKKASAANTPPPAETPKEAKPTRSAPAESSPSTRRTREAPAPINTLPGTGTGNVPPDPSRMSFQELRAYERQKAAAKRAGANAGWRR